MVNYGCDGKRVNILHETEKQRTAYSGKKFATLVMLGSRNQLPKLYERLAKAEERYIHS